MDTVALRLKFIPLIILSHFVFIYRVYIFRLYNSFERVYIRVYISWKFGFRGIGIELEAKTKTHGVILFSKVVAIRRIVRRDYTRFIQRLLFVIFISVAHIMEPRLE